MPQVTTETPQSLASLVSSIAIDVSGTNKFRRFQKTYTNDRVAFAYDIMPDFTHSLAFYQEEILSYFDEGKTRVAVRGPHGLGKTTLAAILVHHSVLTSEADAKIPTTASAWRQLEKYLWPEIQKLSKFIAWPMVGRPPYDPRTEFLQLSIKMRDRDVEAFALASDDHTTLEGAHATRIVFAFDEAKTIPVPTWDAVEGAFSTEGLSDDYDAIAFAISTPGDPSGRFYEIHNHNSGYEDWTTRHVTVDEAIRAGRISSKWVEQRRRQWGQDSSVFINRVLGEFADNTEEGVIPLSWIRAANDRWTVWDSHGRRGGVGSKRAGVDVARGGADSTVIALAYASTLTDLHIFQKLPTTAVSGHVKRLCADRSVNIEGDALGAAVYDMLKEQGVSNVRLIHPGGKTWLRDRSGELGFFNVRAAMWWNLREMLDPEHGDGIALPPDELLTGDLTAPKWDMTSNGLIKLEPKKDIKARIGRSPDRADAVCYAFWNASRGGGVVF
jgi:hypothetical protein